jgi:uncharacterized DUF497 family protein
MQRFDWNDDKNRWLQVHRGMSFEQLRDALLAEGLLDILGPSDPARYPNQRRYVVFCEGYTWSVPAVVDGETVFFKTAYRDRRLDRRYRR